MYILQNCDGGVVSTWIEGIMWSIVKTGQRKLNIERIIFIFQYMEGEEILTC